MEKITNVTQMSAKNIYENQPNTLCVLFKSQIKKKERETLGDKSGFLIIC